MHLLIRNILISPRFLYRSLDPDGMDDFDLATRLSYFLTQARPMKRSSTWLNAAVSLPPTRPTRILQKWNTGFCDGQPIVLCRKITQTP